MPGKRSRVTARTLAVGLLALAALPSLTGCEATVRSAAAEVPRIAVPVAVDELLDSLEDARVRERIVRLMATPEMQRAVEEYGAAATRGGLEGAANEEARQRLAALSTGVAEAFTHALADRLLPDQPLGRALAGSAARATQDSVRAAAGEIPASLGPAVRQSLITELGTPELRKAIAETTADVTRETLIESRDVIAEMQAQPHQPGLIERIDRLLSFGWFLGIAAAVGAAGLFMRAMSLHRRIEATRLDGASELAARALSAAEGKPWSGELRALLREQVRSAEEVSRVRERSGGGGWWPPPPMSRRAARELGH
jgi:hypothetical protein